MASCPSSQPSINAESYGVKVDLLGSVAGFLGCRPNSEVVVNPETCRLQWTTNHQKKTSNRRARHALKVSERILVAVRATTSCFLRRSPRGSVDLLRLLKFLHENKICRGSNCCSHSLVMFSLLHRKDRKRWDAHQQLKRSYRRTTFPSPLPSLHRSIVAAV